MGTHHRTFRFGVWSVFAILFAVPSQAQTLGITTDIAFCGVVGGTNRKEYTMIGDCVNMAARLMQVWRCLLRWGCHADVTWRWGQH